MQPWGKIARLLTFEVDVMKQNCKKSFQNFFLAIFIYFYAMTNKTKKEKEEQLLQVGKNRIKKPENGWVIGL